ncbi:MAG: response regulator [Proteobacteria bacterium]|nr:MAG: response regulator [Pseudomonadota bacterium]
MHTTALSHYPEQVVEKRAAVGTVVIVDDQATSRQILAEIIKKTIGGVEILTFDGAPAALEWMNKRTPDLIVADYKMPEMNGIEFIRRIRELPNGFDIPVVIVTIVEDREVRYQALEAGATDFLTKPVDRHECAARCRNLLTLRNQQHIIRDRADWLEQQVGFATREVRERERETLLRLAKAGEFRDEETFNHVLRVKRYTRIIAEDLGFPEEQCEVTSLAATLHDIGKVGIPDGILLKMGRYTPAEKLFMQQHTHIGYNILKDSPSKYLQAGAIIALNHHERFDGTGYPQRLAGDAIPMAARIVAVTDVFDALTSRRPYKKPWKLEDAFHYIQAESGKHFDPLCIEIMTCNKEKVAEVHNELQDPDSTFQ